MSNKNRNREGFVYSTNPDFQYKDTTPKESATLPPQQQRLKVSTDSRMRAGKTVTVVDGFIGKEDDLEALGKMLKTSCGTGGSVKDGMVLIQGDQKTKVIDLLKKKGYNVK